MKNLELKKSKTFNLVQRIEYVAHSIVTKVIVKKSTGNITLASFDCGESMPEMTSPFDTLIQVIDGMAEITINGNCHELKTGQAIIIPAHHRNTIKANERFKMISTVIMSGYNEVRL